MAEYVYLPLEDARKSVGMKVNLFGVITEIRSAKHSRGTDFVSTMKIVDQSYQNSGLPVNFFAENTLKLPHVKSAGDILSLHRVMVKVHNGESYFVFNKRFSSFALFEGKSSNFNPYQASAKFQTTKYDKDILMQLRSWLPDLQISVGLKQLRNIKNGETFDLICKVIHVEPVAECEYVLFVWDGTDSPPITFRSISNAQEDILPPLHPEAFSLFMEVMLKCPPVGTVLSIRAAKFFQECKQLEGGSQWVRLDNIKCKEQAGMWKGFLQPCSKINPVSDEDENAVTCTRKFNERMACKLSIEPMTSFPRPSHITETDYDSSGYSTLRQSLVHKEVTHKFKTIVRFIAAYPLHADNFRSPEGHYRVRVTLEDPTARIHAYIYKEDGIKFFGGFPTTDQLSCKMNLLLGIPNEGEESSLRVPPWVYCCLKSYYTDKNDPSGNRKYRIFGTTLVG